MSSHRVKTSQNSDFNYEEDTLDREEYIKFVNEKRQKFIPIFEENMSDLYQKMKEEEYDESFNKFQCIDEMMLTLLSGGIGYILRVYPREVLDTILPQLCTMLTEDWEGHEAAREKQEAVS